jgi:hypothetical protein
MARLIGPDEACRVVYLTSGTDKGKASAQGMSAPIYADQALTTLADIVSTTDGVIAASTVTVDAYSKIPLFKYPDGVDTVYTSVNGGPAVALYARTDDRLDTLATRMSAVESGGAGDALVLHKAGAETVTGVKSFTAEPVIPAPTMTTSPATKAYVDTASALNLAKASNLTDVGDPVAALANLGGVPRVVSPRDTFRVQLERRPTLLVDRVFPNVYVDHKIVYVDDVIMYGVGHDCSLRSSADAGLTWTLKLANSGGFGQWAKAGMFLKTAAGSLITTYHPFDLTAPKIQRSTNGGVTWTDVVAAQTNVDYLGPTSICQDPVTGYLYLTEYVTVIAATQATWKISR